MSLDDELTKEEKKLIDKTFSKMIKDRKYNEALTYFNKLNKQARDYICEHYDHSWYLLVVHSAPKHER